MNKKFCPNCGHPIKNDADFCPNCGTKLNKKQENPTKEIHKEPSSTQAVSQEPQSRVAMVKNKAPMSKKTKLQIVIAAIVLIIIILFVGIGNWYYPKANQVNRIVNTLQTSTEVSKVIKPEDTAVKVTKENSKSTREYFKNLANVAETENSLVNNGTYGDYTLVEDGKNLLFFPKYKLEVPTYNPTVTTSHANSTIYVNGKNVGKVSSDGADNYSHKIGPLLQGAYSIKISSKVHGKTLTAKLNEEIKSNANISMDIKTASFKVKSVPNGVVYINGEKAGKLSKNGMKKFTDYPITDNMSLYVETTVKGKKVKSEVMKNVESQVYDDETTTLEPEFAGQISKTDAEDLLTRVLDTDDPDEDSFVDGNNSRAYHLIVDALKKTSDMDGFESIGDCKVKILNTKLTSNRESTINFQVSYEFDFEDKTNKQTIEWDGCIIQNNGSTDNPNYQIKELGNSKMISNEDTAD
ncbi:TcaA 3rd/4th domain-containing protein [Lactobacillus sp. PV034]|uniref:TcaA 3rd/4th domain-containing protein n=1 Tax=Lactobacillus sp. PV034 TaxID=2594495 RepID=UPI00223F67EE|nr:zinc-ribbon domain-containing protein [Lactobacillus sp. PV034]QNQ81289.1 zinc-ribbon domain-containing protein [Lactobacillus sp. PV034]